MDRPFYTPGYGPGENERYFNSIERAREAMKRGAKRKYAKKTKRRRSKSSSRPVKKRLFRRKSSYRRRNKGNKNVTACISRRRWKPWMRKGMRDLRQLKKYQNVFAVQSTNAIGYQQTAEIRYLNMTDTAAAPAVDPGTSLYQAIRYVWWSYNNTLGTGNRVRYLYIEAINVKLQITSASQFDQTVTIRDIIARRDHNINPIVAWNNGLTEGNKAISVQGATPGTASSQTYMVTPYQSNQFCQLWKIINDKTITLEPGKTHIHYHKVAIKKRINVDEFKSEDQYRKGLCTATLITHHGQPASSTTTENVQSLGGRLNIIVTFEMTYKIDHNENTDQNIIFNNMSSAGTFVPEIINTAVNDVDQTMANA